MGERGKHAVVTEELLEHLRGRFDEIPLDVEGGLAGVGVLPADDVMHEVAELMQEDDDVAVLHESRIPRRATREVAYQRPLGQLPPVYARGEGLRREPLVLALARMHVQVDAPEAYVALVDVVARHGGMPGAHAAHRADVDMEQP